MNKRGRRRHNNDYEEDRLSDLPDCVLLHIMSFLKTKCAVQTCILSKRWKNLWKHLPILTLYSSNFKVVSKILSHSTSLQVLNFYPLGFMVHPRLLKYIILYTLSRNVKQLEINLLCDVQHLPRCLFSSQLLTHLHLSVCRPNRDDITLFPNSLNMPALTKLSLRNFVFCVGDDGRVEPFSSCNKLNTLIIEKCQVVDKQNLCISSTTLVNLKIISWYNPPEASFKFELSTPSLCNFYFRGTPLQKLRGSKINLSSIKHVDFGVGLNSADSPLVLFNWLVELANIESLTLSYSTLQVLSSIPDLLKIEFPSLRNLKSLKVKSFVPLCSIPVFRISADFLLQNSPSAEGSKYKHTLLMDYFFS